MPRLIIENSKRKYMLWIKFYIFLLPMISEEQMILYRNLFRWREDIYAYRWEKNGKSGYSPAYQFERYKFKVHKERWGTMSTFEDKTMKQLTNEVLQSHCSGDKVIWIYPLLEDNTSHFVSADFDKDNREQECKQFLYVCDKYEIPAYLERSRSGNGGHVRVFFEEKFIAIKTRKIFLELVRESFGISQFEKEISFDRLFPNQDYLTKKWFGNLIALPLQWKSLSQWNSAFVDIDTMKAYPNQRDFLESIQKISIKKLDELHLQLVDKSLFAKTTGDNIRKNKKIEKKAKGNKLEIILENQILLPRFQMPALLIKFITDELNFFNLEYITKKRLWKSVYNTKKYFNCIQEDDDYVFLPRWFFDDLVSFCIENKIPHDISDKRKLGKTVNYDNNITLYDYQKHWLESTHAEDFGVIVSPPWSGKTVMALDLIARKQQRTLIVVHRQQLFDQWIERIQSFLWIMKKDIGQIKWAKRKIGNKITVAMLQTLSKMDDEKIHKTFWTIIIDECHHIPAKTFREAITKFHSHYFYGFTATPKRKNNDEKLIYAYIWPIISEIHMEVNKQEEAHQIIVKETNLYVPFDYKIDNYETISKILVFDTQRNQQIIKDILWEVQQNKKILVLTERKEHIDVLSLYLKRECEVITLSWDDSQRMRTSKIKQIEDGHFQVLIATWQLLGEGRDISNLQVLFLVYPFSFEGKLIQYIWRLQRNKTTNKIYDYRDNNIDYFEKLFKKRYRYYRKIQGENYEIRDGQARLF